MIPVLSVAEMQEHIGADSLAFLSVEGLYASMGYDRRDAVAPQFTDHCFTGDYPTDLVDANGDESVHQLSFLAEVPRVSERRRCIVRSLGEKPFRDDGTFRLFRGLCRDADRVQFSGNEPELIRRRDLPR